MSNNLYFICPTDNLESIINSTFNVEKYYVTSLANSITFNHQFIKALCSTIEYKGITDVTFILSDDNQFVRDALQSKDFKNIRGLESFYQRISKHKNFINTIWYSSDIRQILISYMLNLKKREFQNIINSSVQSLNINAMIYNKERNEFNKVRSELLNLEFFNLN